MPRGVAYVLPDTMGIVVGISFVTLKHLSDMHRNLEPVCWDCHKLIHKLERSK